MSKYELQYRLEVLSEAIRGIELNGETVPEELLTEFRKIKEMWTTTI